MSQASFSVIEARWWSDGNHTVRNLFGAVAEIHYGNPSAFYYDMFSDKGSLAAILKTRGSDGTTEVVYLATHGDETSIDGIGDISISRTELRNAVTAANLKKKVRGLFLGTCLLGNEKMASFMLDSTTNLHWVAGYREEIDWVDGSAIDMIFFSKLAAEYVENRSRKKKHSPYDMAHTAATELAKLVPGAHSVYGFNLYHLSAGKVIAMYK